MTTPRIARAGRTRFFVAIGVLVLIVGFISIINNAQQQLDESNALRLRSEQQYDALNARLQAIVDHKFRLEKSLEMERKEHVETKENFEKQLKEIQMLSNKQTLEAGTRLDSSQQHLKILQSKHTDLTENCAKTKQTQSEQINALEKTVKTLENQIKLLKTNNANDIEVYKVKVSNLKQQLDDLANLKEKKISQSDLRNPETVAPKDEQLVSKNLYETTLNSQNMVLGNNNNNIKSNVELDGAEAALALVYHENKNINLENQAKRKYIGAIINSVENFQIAPKPIMSKDDLNINNDVGDSNAIVQQPPPLGLPLKSSTSTQPSVKYNNDFNKRALLIAPTSENIKSLSSSITLSSNSSTSSSTTESINYHELINKKNRLLEAKRLPKGVPPVPEDLDLLLNDENNQNDLFGDKHYLVENANVDDSNKNDGNNRYANVINEFSNNINKKEGEVEDDGEEKNVHMNIAESDKLNEKDALQAVLNNAAEDDTNNFFDSKFSNKNNNDDKVKENDDIEKEKPDELPKKTKHHHHSHRRQKNDEKNKLINEVVGDQGKEPEYGIEMEEGAEEDEDEDDYSNPAARQQEGAAVRN